MPYYSVLSKHAIRPKKGPDLYQRSNPFLLQVKRVPGDYKFTGWLVTTDNASITPPLAAISFRN